MLQNDLLVLIAEPALHFSTGALSPAAAEALGRLPEGLRRLGASLPAVRARRASCPLAAEALVEEVSDKVLVRLIGGEGLGDQGHPRAYVRMMFQNAARDLARRCRVHTCGCTGGGQGSGREADPIEQLADEANRPELAAREAQGAAAEGLRCVEALVEQLAAARKRPADAEALRQAWRGLLERLLAERSMQEQLEAEQTPEARRSTELSRRQKGESRLKDALFNAIVDIGEGASPRPAECHPGELPELVARAQLALR